MSASSERTEVLAYQTSVIERAVAVFSRAKDGLDILSENAAVSGPLQSEESKKVGEAYLGIGMRGGRLRVITKIDEKNVEYCKEIAKNVELRHLEEVIGSFAVSDSEYMSSPTSSVFDPGAVVTVIYSNVKSLVEQNRDAFERFWNRAEPAAERIAEIEEGRPHRQTRIIRGEEVAKSIGAFLTRAAAGKQDPHAFGTSDMESTARASEGPYYEASRQLLRQTPGFKIRHITDIQTENLDGIKRLLEIGYDVRHIEGNRIRFSVSRDEYIEVVHSDAPGAKADEIVWSNDPQIISQATRMFEALWDTGIPSDFRIRELEGGAARPVIRIIRDPDQIQKLYLDLVNQAKDEILLILPTTNAFRREETIGVVEAMQTAAMERGIKVSIIAPNPLVQQSLQALSEKVEAKVGRKMVEHRLVLEAKTPNTVTVLVVDRNASLVIEQKDNSQLDFDKAIGVATYSTRNSTVLANVRFFERVWEEVELRDSEAAAVERERRSRKTAELLQDILSHDITNYNQVTITSAEMLRGRLGGNAKVLSEATTLLDSLMNETDHSSETTQAAQKAKADLSRNVMALTDANTLIDGIIKATNGSSDLIDRARKLGRVISQEEIQLHAVDLESAIRKSMDLVVDAHPSRSVKSSLSMPPGAQVLADEMLAEVFTNVLSNSVNYTQSDEVPVEIEVEGATLDGNSAAYWKIAFIDHGKGIPDETKEQMFARYLKAASGTGLGLSIVYALAVERYSGKVRIADRVEGDRTKGTRIEIWLPKSA